MAKLKKMLLALCSALLLVSAALCAVACGETGSKSKYTVTLDYNAEQGAVALSPSATDGKYDEGTSVTVTVTAKLGFEVDKVEVGGEAVTLTQDAYTFTVESDITVKATFKSLDEPDGMFSVTLDYNKDQGDVTLSPASVAWDNKYAGGTSVTVTVAPKSGFEVDKVEVGGKEVQLTENAYAFTVDANVTVKVTFKSTQTPPPVTTVDAKYIGVWSASAVDVGESTGVEITADGAVFQTKECALTAVEGGYTFTYTDDEGTSVVYTVKLPADLSDKVLVLSHAENDEDVSVYLLKENDTYPSVTFGEGLVGSWSPESPMGEPITIDENSLTMGNNAAAKVLSVTGTEATTLTYVIYANATVYTLTYTAEVEMVSPAALSLLAYGEAATSAVSYTKDESAEPVALPAEYEGTWQDAENTHTIVIDQDGKLTFDSKPCDVYAFDVEMYWYTFTDESGNLWNLILPMSADGQMTLYQMGEDSFSLSKPAAPTDEKYIGVWSASAMDVGDNAGVTITADGAVFQTKECALTAVEGGYTFTYTDDEGASVVYTVKLPADLADKVLVLTHKENSEDVSVYLLKANDTYPSVSFDALVGDWNPDEGAGDPISVNPFSITVGSSLATVVAQNTEGEHAVYTLYVAGSVYIMTVTGDATLTLLPYGEETAVAYTLYVPESVALPDSFKGTWSDGTHTAVVDNDGKLTLDGEECVVFVSDADMKWYGFTDDAGNEWIFYESDGGIYFQQGYNDSFTLYPKGILPAEFEGVWKNSDHTIEISNGNLVVDHDPYEPTDAGDGKYSFTMGGMPYQIYLEGDDLVLACVEPDMEFTSVLTKQGGVSAWDWGVSFETMYAGVYSDGEHTLIIYQDGKVTFDGHKAKVLNIGFSTFDTKEYDSAQFDLDNGDHWQFYGISNVWSDENKKIPLINGDGETLTLPYTGEAPATWEEGGSGPVDPADPEYWVYFNGGDHWDDNEMPPEGVYATKDNEYVIELPEGPAAAYGYKFIGWQKDGTDEVYQPSDPVTISADNTSFTALWDNYFESDGLLALGTWGQSLPVNTGFTVQKGEKLVLTGSFSGKAATDVYQGIVTQAYVNGEVGENKNYYFFRPDCPVNVVEGAWKFWAESGCTYSNPQWVEASYKALTGGDVVITVALSSEGVLTVEVAFTSAEYSYTNLYTVSDAMNSALIFFAQDGCTADPVTVKHYKLPDLFTAEQQGVYKSADGNITVTVTGTTVTLEVKDKETKTVNAAEILVGADGQYGLFTYVSTKPNQEPMVTLEYVDGTVSLLDDFAEYLGAKDVELTKQDA